MPRLKKFVDDSVIIETAYNQIDKDGYSAFSLRGLARELKVNPMTLYHYVTNKEEIVKQVLLKGLAMLQTVLENEISRFSAFPKSPADIYQVLARISLDFARTHKNLYLLIFDTEHTGLEGDRELTAAYRGARSLFWDKLHSHAADMVSKEIILFETLMNALVLRHLRHPETFKAEAFFDLINLSLERLFTGTIQDSTDS